MKKLLFVAATLLAFHTQAAQDPQAVFDRSCGVCHKGQLPLALQKGDAAWEPLLDKGMDTLVTHVTNGFNAMPPRGMCLDCAAEDYKAVIEWMSK